MDSVGIVSGELLFSVIDLVKLFTGICPRFTNERCQGVAVMHSGAVNFWEFALEAEPLQNGAQIRYFDAIKTITDYEVFAKHAAKLTIHHIDILNVENGIPSSFTGMDKPIQQLFTFFVLPVARIEPVAQFIQINQAVFVFVVNRRAVFVELHIVATKADILQV